MSEILSLSNIKFKFLEVVIVIYFGILNKNVCHLKKVTIIPLRDENPAPTLSCWACEHTPEAPNMDCVEGNRQNMTKSVCSLYQPFCEIQRSEHGSRVVRMLRTCSKECTPGCNKFETFTRCDVCCTQPLCNNKNAVITIQLHSNVLIVSICVSFFISLIRIV